MRKKGQGGKHTRPKKWSGARRPAGPATTALQCVIILPDLRHCTGYVACPRKLGSPKTTSYCTINLISARSGHTMCYNLT